MGSVLPKHQWNGSRRRSGWRGVWRPLLVLAVILGGWRLAQPWLYEDEGERVSTRFTICEKRSSTDCVLDGDTFRIADRTIRVAGIDAPETHPARCEEEARLGAKATEELARQLNSGAFVMVPVNTSKTDKYGRELRALYHLESGGGRRPLADSMMASGTVRPYAAGARLGWCGPESSE